MVFLKVMLSVWLFNIIFRGIVSKIHSPVEAALFADDCYTTSMQYNKLKIDEAGPSD